MPLYKAEWLTQTAPLGDCWHLLLLAPQALGEDVCTQPKSSLLSVVLPGSMGGLWESTAFVVLSEVQQNPSHLSLGGYTGRNPTFGGEEVSLTEVVHGAKMAFIPSMGNFGQPR